MKGERRSIKRGTSIEFADYRNYVAGDDLRRLDWNIYARLERPYIKLLEDEEDLAVHLLLDTSASMDWPKEGDPEQNKLLYGKRLFAALAYISLSTNDRLTMNSVNARGFEQFGPARGRGQGVAMLRYVQNLEAAGVTDLNESLRLYTARSRRPGLLILISDMFSPSGYMEGLNRLLGKGFEVLILHLLSPDEVSPPLAGDLRLIDVETDQGQEVTIDATMRAIYQQRLESWLTHIREACGRRNIHYLMLQTDAPWERVILHDLRRMGIVK
jgi:uncharacterized protein (DUF58 family)